MQNGDIPSNCANYRNRQQLEHVNNYPVRLALIQCSLSEWKVLKIYIFRRICMMSLSQMPRIISGPGTIVEIDFRQFNRRKYNPHIDGLLFLAEFNAAISKNVLLLGPKDSHNVKFLESLFFNQFRGNKHLSVNHNVDLFDSKHEIGGIYSVEFTETKN
ncbi:LOW QUALITY PROTEIN: hypothetical protein HZS_2504 [Henneguya salminicola]|nr:LOW QUALITY PROTEIN: hypothetical protein HZS_2504 [Henneguya salminicola]